jgi:ATP-dependent Clp protease ATP-binding subunit ClpA
VGKTELSKALANFLFGEDDALIQIDMGEFHDRYTASRLFGAPPGSNAREMSGFGPVRGGLPSGHVE